MREQRGAGADVMSPPDGPVRGAIVRVIVRHPWLTVMALASVVAVGAAIVVVSGIVPIKASSGHWRITAGLLEFAKSRSVATHSLGITSPDLDDDGLIRRGAGHYETGCYPCHGKPGTNVPPVMAAMTPSPPTLSRIGRFTPSELFVIVKHGIKFTGMPAWPAQQRDDEVWAVVAFLRRLSALDAGTYRQLAQGDGAPPDAAPRPVRDLCWRCHGADGTGRGPSAFPSLAGQHSAYLYASLRAFATRTRFSGIMGGVAATLSDDQMREVAAYYESLAGNETRRTGDVPAAARGAIIAGRGIADRDIPACVECHGPHALPKNPAYPRLAGQHARYLRSQLQLLKERRRGGTSNVDLMHVFIDRLTASEISDLSRYYESQPRPY
jgi:cytochrome c553